MKRTMLKAVTAIFVFTAIFSVDGNADAFKEVYLPWKDVRVINSGWEYVEPEYTAIAGKPPYQKVNLPHTWNALDALGDPEDYRRGVSWYRKWIEFSNKERGQRLFFRFGAAGQVADVYLNDRFVGRHSGGYTAFTVEVTRYVQPGRNLLAVKVSNEHNEEVAPLSGDFNVYGGLYRSVQLIAAPLVHLSRKHRGGPGVRVWSPSVSEARAEVMVSALVDNGEKQDMQLQFRLVAELSDPQGRVVSRGEKNLRCAGLSVEKAELSLADVVRPQLWTPDEPVLYELSVRLYRGEQLLDEMVVHHGFRWYRFDANKGFFLNGKPLRLQGVNRHQDFYKLGNALPPSRHIEDIKLIKELGCNWLRLAHYPQDNLVLELCDRLGLLVWEEIPLVNDITYKEQFYANCESQMREMIEQHFNHPSVVLWGLSNEVLLGKKADSRPVPLLKRLHRIVHEEDPIRLSVIACHRSTDYAKYGLTVVPDVVGYNLYYGWYYDEISDLTGGLEEFHRLNPDKPLIVSEYGAGSELSRHTLYPARFDFSEEYQVLYHESHLEQFERLGWLSGTNVWNVFDFGAVKRGDTIPHVNQKGLLTFDRKEKDVFYLYEARWTDEPVVHILSPSWRRRSGRAEKDYKVISNCDQVELFHQGRSLGRKSRGFQWKVILEEGSNELVVRGKKGKPEVEHTIEVVYERGQPLRREAIRVNCGGGDYRDSEGKLWLADQSYVEGQWGSSSGQQEYEEDIVIADARDVVLFQNHRVGSQAYHFELPAGRYKVRLGLLGVPRGKVSSGAREFDIKIQGRTVEEKWKFLNKPGLRKAFWREYETAVKGDEGLEIKFEMSRYNHSVICAIEAVPF